MNEHLEQTELEVTAPAYSGEPMDIYLDSEVDAEEIRAAMETQIGDLPPDATVSIIPFTALVYLVRLVIL